MKRTITLLTVLLLAVLVLTSCGETKDEKDSKEPEAISSLKTIGDVIALEKEENQFEVSNGKVVCAFKYEDGYYRITADIPEDTEKKYIDIDITKEGSDKKQEELVAPLKIKKVENLSDKILKKDELKALAGKTGKELADEGWTYNGSYELDEKKVWMNNGPFVYIVVFDGDFKNADSDNFDVEKETANMKVKSVKFETLGDNATSE